MVRKRSGTHAGVPGGDPEDCPAGRYRSGFRGGNPDMDKFLGDLIDSSDSPIFKLAMKFWLKHSSFSVIEN